MNSIKIEHSPLRKQLLFSAILTLSVLCGCAQEQQAKSTLEPTTFTEAFTVMANSCMPCHNHGTLPAVIAKTKAADFEELEGETRQRIVGALEGLLEDMEEGVALSFVTEKEVTRFLTQRPGELYLMVERGAMPPPWASALTAKLNWPYVHLTVEKRVELLKFAKKNAPR